MNDGALCDLAHLFQAVLDVMIENRLKFNQADVYNANHGDHLVEIFQDATRAVLEKQEMELAEAMGYGAQVLSQKQDNGSALVYGRGLEQFAKQFRERQISFDELLAYVQGILAEDGERDKPESNRAGDVLKALVGGLTDWQKAEQGSTKELSGLDMGALFELGMAYLQAKQRGGSRIEILADAAASVSPLRNVPYRYESGKVAIQTLLQAMLDPSDDQF